MHRDELIPCAAGTLGGRFDPLFLEDVADCLSADTVNTETSQLAKNASITHAGLTGDFANQLSQNLSLARPSRLIRLIATPLLPDPAMKGFGCDDLDQSVNVATERFAKFEQASTFFLGGVNLTGNASAEEGEFFGEILDMPGQPMFGRVGEQQQQRVKQPRHRVPASICDNMLSNQEIALFLYPAATQRDKELISLLSL